MTDTRFKFYKLWKIGIAVGLTVVAVGIRMSVIQAQLLVVDPVSYSSLLYFNTDLSDSDGGVDLKNSNNSGLVVLGADIKGTDSGRLATIAVANSVASADAVVKSEILGKVLFYPNPIRQVDNPKLWYELSKNMDVEIRLYDMLARMILKSQFPSGTDGGRAGVNVVQITMDTFAGYKLSSGVYFAVIMSEGRVLGKGKVAILP